jgi:hypothetical protein
LLAIPCGLGFGRRVGDGGYEVLTRDRAGPDWIELTAPEALRTPRPRLTGGAFLGFWTLFYGPPLNCSGQCFWKARNASEDMRGGVNDCADRFCARCNELGHAVYLQSCIQCSCREFSI